MQRDRGRVRSRRQMVLRCLPRQPVVLLLSDSGERGRRGFHHPDDDPGNDPDSDTDSLTRAMQVPEIPPIGEFFCGQDRRHDGHLGLEVTGQVAVQGGEGAGEHPQRRRHPERDCPGRRDRDQA